MRAASAWNNVVVRLLIVDHGLYGINTPYYRSLPFAWHRTSLHVHGKFNQHYYFKQFTFCKISFECIFYFLELDSNGLFLRSFLGAPFFRKDTGSRMFTLLLLYKGIPSLVVEILCWKTTLLPLDNLFDVIRCWDWSLIQSITRRDCPSSSVARFATCANARHISSYLNCSGKLTNSS